MAKRLQANFPSEDKDGKRRCVYCGVWKPLVDYHKDGFDERGKQKYRQDCKTCYNIRRKENRNPKSFSDFIGSSKRREHIEIVDFSHEDWKQALLYFGGECAYCGATPRKGQLLTKDHLHPVSKGGATISSNIIPACRSCNSSKNNVDWKDWYMSQPFFSQERMNRIFKWRTIMRMAEGGDCDGKLDEYGANGIDSDRSVSPSSISDN